MKRSLVAVLTILLSFVNHCMLRAQQKESLPIYREIELSGNLYTGSHNPSSLWFSPLESMFDFHAGYDIRRGDLHNVDESSKTNSLEAGLSGQHRFDKVICFGSVDYSDGKDFARRWNSTLQIADDNPFIIGDSIPSDYNTQRFMLTGAVAYRPVEKLILAMRLDYDTGSVADQTDPRPKTDGMHFIVTPGIHYLPGKGFAFGLSGGINLMNESTEHAVIDPRESYVYFRFNGLGDYSTISSGTSLLYPRDYKGFECKGAFQFAWDGGRGIANMLEAVYSSNEEKARDGGVVFTFLGGDYKRTSFGATDRLRFAGDRSVHNLSLGWKLKQIEGVWYEQTAFSDPDKNNQLSFKVQASGLKYKENTSVYRAEYRFDLLRNAVPTFTVNAGAIMEQSDILHFEGDGYNRNYTRLRGSIETSKHFAFGRNRISATFGLQGGVPLSSSQSVRDRIEDVYTDPTMEYLTATWAGGNAAVHYLRLFGKIWTGVYAETSLKYYLDDGQYTAMLEGSDYIRCRFGAQLLF